MVQMWNEYDNSRPFDIHRWSDYREVNNAVDHIYREILTIGEIERQYPSRTKKYVKVLALDLYVSYVMDHTAYIGISRHHNSYKNDRYNALFIKPELLKKITDWFRALGYIEFKIGFRSPKDSNRDTDKGSCFGRQSRMRATSKFIDLIETQHAVSPLMVKKYAGAETIILRDSEKKKLLYDDTEETISMRSRLEKINALLDMTLMNLYLPDEDFHKLNHRMINGEIMSDLEHEEPRGAIDFSRRSLYRIFSNGSFDQGGRFYGGWWQGIPREFRKHIRINHNITRECDFSGIHINFLYAQKNMDIPFHDPYHLDGYPVGTRKVVKRSLLTMINAKDKPSALKSLRRQIADKEMILPDGINKIEEIIAPFEKKHEAIKEYFFSGQGVFLQKWDSRIAEEIMYSLANNRIPALPLHDSFIVSEHQERGLRAIMREAYDKIVGRSVRIDSKTSLLDVNLQRPFDELQEEQDRRTSGENNKGCSEYYRRNQEWLGITGKPNIFPFIRGKMFNRESYE